MKGIGIIIILMWIVLVLNSWSIWIIGDRLDDLEVVEIWIVENNSNGTPYYSSPDSDYWCGNNERLLENGSCIHDDEYLDM